MVILMHSRTVIFSILIVVLLAGCLSQFKQKTGPEAGSETTGENQGTETGPQNQGGENGVVTPPQENPPANNAEVVSGEFELRAGESIDGLRGAGIYGDQSLELRIHSIGYSHFPTGKMAVFEAIGEDGVQITSRQTIRGRYLDEDILYNSRQIFLDRIYVKDIIVTEAGNSVILQVN